MDYAGEAFNKVIQLKPAGTVLDVGCGSGQHSKAFADKGYDVYAIDIMYHQSDYKNVTFLQGSYDDFEFEEDYDIVWCSHVLEHQLNVNNFLTWAARAVKENGILAITVPPPKGQIVSGHYTVWNAGLILYNLVMARIDCRHAMIKQYDYNISVIVKVKSIALPELYFDRGDLTVLRDFFPPGLITYGDSFMGDITELNWDV